jgi:CelD/BcsL family acetyltransferase involved in cellulose biosynthesis
MRTEILTTVGQIQKIADAWLRLVENYPLGFFNGPVYYNLAHYRRGFVQKVKYPLYFIVVMDEKDRVCGILPTCRRRFSSKLLFMNGEASEIIAEPERREQVLSELGNCIKARRLWIHSDFIHEGSLLQELYRRLGWETEAWNTSYYADLSGGHEAYVRTHDGRTVKKLAAEEKKVEGLGRCELEVCVTADVFEKAFDDFLKLHLKRWGAEAKSLGDPSTARVMRTFARYFMRRDRLFLSFLKIDDARVSAYFGIIDGNAVYYLSSGREPVYDSYGVGKIHLLKIFRWCCEHDVRLFSFLSGVNTLKEKFATHSVAIYRNKLRH